MVALSVIALTHHAYAYALFERGAGTGQFLRPIQRDARARDLLARAVLSTCHPGDRDRWNVIGVNYMWMNANSANFYAEMIGARTGSRCRYTNLGGMESELRFALDRIASIDPLYIVTIAVGHQPPPDSINQFSRPLAEHLAGDARFRFAPGSDDTLLIYRRER